MDRKEIKESARGRIKGNLWNIWWPMLIIGFINGIFNRIFSPKVTVNIVNMSDLYNFSSIYKLTPIQSIGLSVGALLTAVLAAGYLMYIINFIRTGEFDSKVIINTIKEKWVNLLIAGILSSIIVAFASLFLIIPGIIMGLAYTLVFYLVVDSDISGKDALTKSREMMRGHKWEYFVFMLSFLGWMLLVPITLGLLLIWLVPYITVSTATYYEKLKEVSK